MKWFSRLSIVLLLVLGAQAHAGLSDRAEYSSNLSKAYFFIGPQVVTLNSDSASIYGYGGEIGFQYLFLSDWKFEARAAQVFNQEDNSLLYTNFSGSLHYAFGGEYQKRSRQIFFDRKKVLDFIPTRDTTWSVGLGLDQFLLSGTSSVFSGVGLCGYLGLGFEFWNFPLEASLRYGVFTANQQATVYGSATLSIVLSP